MRAVTGKEMKEIDQKTINEYNIPGIVLMEHAATEAVRIIKDDVIINDKILILCGTGNNGGDGFAIARMLKHQKYNVRVGIIGDLTSIKGDARINYEIINKLDIDIVDINSENEFCHFQELLTQSDVIIDAILGTGCSRELMGHLKNIVNEVNEAQKKTFAIDIPTGINADNGQVMGGSIHAYKTITFCLPKIGLYLQPGAAYTGEVVTVDIGIPDSVINAKTSRYKILDDSIYSKMPERKMISHKGSYGRVLIVAGSKNMMGALLLSSLAAYKTGAGLVSVLTEKGNEQALFGYVPEAIVHGYTKEHKIFADELDKINGIIKEADAILIGPGLSSDDYAKALLGMVLTMDKPVVIDADGLNLLAKDMSLLNNRNNHTIITPHIGEMSRLTKLSREEILSDMPGYAAGFSREHDVITVLKSAKTVIATKDETYINPFGNPGMATAGSGDVLAGIIISLIGQGLASEDAAILGVYIHSKAGDVAKDLHGEYGLIARDIIGGIERVCR